jgi:tRNA(fMet)-specific endonuclease VapC
MYLAFDQMVVKKAVEINNNLKRKRKQIELADLFIAATAIANNMPFATLNKKHFERIDEIYII